MPFTKQQSKQWRRKLKKNKICIACAKAPARPKLTKCEDCAFAASVKESFRTRRNRNLRKQMCTRCKKPGHNIQTCEAGL
jgi:DnaJ-class molecular chaperone